MGNARSKNRFGSRGKKKQHGPGSPQHVSGVGPGFVNPEDEYEDMELKLLRRAIKLDPESFVLNNLMMCVQFFGNYEEEINHVKGSLVSSREAELNDRLPAQKHVLLPDVLQEHVARNVGFTSTRQTLRPTIEPLQPVRIYVVHDNIEITEQNYPPHYSTVTDTVTYSMMLKPSEHQGYVLLQLLDEMSFPRSGTTTEEDVDLSSIAENDDEFYSDGDSVYGPKPSSRVALSRHEQKSSLRYSKLSGGYSRSLSDLRDAQIYGESPSASRSNTYDTRSVHNVKFESDYEHLSSNEERKYRAHKIWSKRDPAKRACSRNLRPEHRSRSRMTNRSPASSTSSGYRSGTYALDSDSDCSCNAHSNYSRSHCCNTSRSCTSCAAPGTCPPPRCSSTTSCSSSVYECNGVHRCSVSQRSCSPMPPCNASHACDTFSNYGTESSETMQCCNHTPKAKEMQKSALVKTPLSNSEIPRRCFKKVTYTSDGRIYDPREERKQLMNSKQRRIRLALRRHNYDVFYISSVEFMGHFIDLFIDQYADSLGFDSDAVDDVKPEGCVIYCDKIMVSKASRHDRIEPYEIIPTLWVQWPECAQEWLHRPRSTWPDYDDLKKVKEFGCYVVPEGFKPKNSSNPSQDLEWQLTFPAAERYLETCMTRTQVQVYLTALMLHKTFLRPVFDTIFGLTTAHIRNKLFWMIEENDRPSKWPENRSGECLLKLLNSLYHCISQNEPTLSDYFVRDRNLFQRVPSEHLLHTQKQLKRIIENPVMYVFHAMENVRHSQKFFPKLDYEMLLKILTVDTLTLINPALGQHVFKQTKMQNDDHYMTEDGDEERTYRPGGFWDSAKMKKEPSNIYVTRTVTNKTLINPRKATDSVIEISIRCAELEGPRLCALLDFFVRHFIKMGEQCHQYRSYSQKAVYLDQADRLSILLSEHERHKEDARAYRDKIRTMRKRCDNLRSTEPPETPKRNEAPIYVASLKDRFSKESLDLYTASSETENYEKPENPYADGDPSNGVTVAAVHEDRQSENTYGMKQEKEQAPALPARDKNPVLDSEVPKRNGLSSRGHPKKAAAPLISESSNSKKTTTHLKNGINKSSDEKPLKNGKVNGVHLGDANLKKKSLPLHEEESSKSPQVVSLVEDENESFLTETTYI